MLRRLPRIRKLSAFADGWAPKTTENGLKTPENGLKTPENGLPVVTRERVRQMHVQAPSRVFDPTFGGFLGAFIGGISAVCAYFFFELGAEENLANPAPETPKNDQK
eukprot:TRINITY_DN3114_c0_g1_i1.p2 TRINITY_DN3114_c0_g1~~TRINITY_DN3114_c0_g1_i1.p2  ORF type:complete len:107 (+),score=11.43 TRINITY_DN3114_c0_g1_i1:41-361(+)